MSWLDRDERNMRLFRHPPQHHEPPLGTPHPPYHCGWDGCDCESMMPPDEQPCADCGWTLEGEWEPCEEHKDE